MSADGLALALFEWLLRAYPSELRRRHGPELRETFLERLRAARQRGRRAVVALWWRELLGPLEARGLLGSSAPRRPLGSPAPRRSLGSPAARGQLGPPASRRSSYRRGAATLPHRPRSPRSGTTLMDTILQDLVYAARTLRKNPEFTAVATLALALGIGANTAIFSVVDAVVLRPLPYEDPERLVALWEKNPERDWFQAQVAAANYLDWREGASTFDDIAAHQDWLEEVGHASPEGPVSVMANHVTGNFFSVLGVPPILGSSFSPEHDWDTSEPAVVLSHGFWQRQFGGTEEIVGRTMILDGVATTVLGVMPADFRQPLDRHNPFPPADLWLPMRWDPASRDQAFFRRAHGLTAIGRLRAGVTPAQARAEIEALMASLEEAYPETNAGMGAGITPLHEWVVEDAERPLLVLLAAVGLVLTIAAANVANMLLARAGSRRSEMAIRTAMGAPRGRLLRQVLTESLLLAAMGGVVGLLVGHWATSAGIALMPGEMPRVEEVGLDLRLVGYALAVVAVTGVAFGLVPALRASGTAPAGTLRDGPTRGSRRARGTTPALVVAEVGLAVVLLVGAGLLVRSFWRLSRVEPGFDPTATLVAAVSLPSEDYPDGEQIVSFYRELQERLGGLPGVISASGSSRLPFVNQRWSSDFTAEGWGADRYGMNVRHDEVLPDFFETMRIPLLEGRTIEQGDGPNSRLVVVVNETLAEQYFQDRSPIGVRVAFDRDPNENSTWRTIVGVVGDVRREGLGVAPKPSFYAPVGQDWTRTLHILARTEGDPRGLAGALRRELVDLDPDLPIHTLTTLEEVVSGSLARERFLLVLLGGFATIAFGLAAVGVYGVISYATSQRTREIGIRLALGANPGDVLRLVVGRGIVPVAVGIALGAGAARLLSRVIEGFLYEVSPADPLTFAAVAATLGAVALIACAIPARRATRVDPTVALRSE